MPLSRLIPLFAATSLVFAAQAADLAVDIDHDVSELRLTAFTAKPDGSTLKKEAIHKKGKILIKDAGTDPVWLLLEEGSFASWSTDYLAAYKIEPKSGPNIHLKYPDTSWEIQSFGYGKDIPQQLIKVERMEDGKPVPVYQSWTYLRPADPETRLVATCLLPGDYRLTAWVLPKGSAALGEETGRCLFAVPAETPTSGKIELKDEKTGEITGALFLRKPEKPAKE